MTLSDRDKRLLIVLPALVAVLGYPVWFASTGKYGSLIAARAAAEAAERAAPPPERVRAVERQIGVAGIEAHGAAEAARAAREALGRHLACVDPECRADRLHKLASLMARHGLTVMEHGDVGKETALPPSVEALRKQLPEARRDGLHLHEVRFAARYGDVRRAAAALADDGAIAVPVSLTMKESPDASEMHEWLMLVWV